MVKTPEELAAMFGGQILKNDDKPIDFSVPIKGKYLATVTEFSRIKDEKKDLIRLKMKINKDLEGDKSFNRIVDKSYWLTDSDYSTAQDNIVKLANDLYTMGTFDKFELPDGQITVDNVDVLLKMNIIGDEVKLSCYKTNTGKQAVKIIINDTNDISWP